MCQQSAHHSKNSDREDDCKDASCNQSNHSSPNWQNLNSDIESCCGETKTGVEVRDGCREKRCGEVEEKENHEHNQGRDYCGEPGELETRENDCQTGCCAEAQPTKIKEDSYEQDHCGEAKCNRAGDVHSNICPRSTASSSQSNEGENADCKKECYGQNSSKARAYSDRMLLEELSKISSASSARNERLDEINKGTSSGRTICCATGNNVKLDQERGCLKRANISCRKGETDQGAISGTNNLSIVEDEPDTCSAHLEAATRKFTAFLETGLCICRSIMSRDDICCNQNKREAASRARLRRKFGNLSTVETSKVTTCGERKPFSSCTEKDRGAVLVFPQCEEKGETSISPVIMRQPGIPMKPVLSNMEPWAKVVDIEQPVAKEHVTFTVTGMTCTSCVKKLSGVSNHIAGLYNLHVNYVVGKAEFDIDPNITDANQALRELERKTGFQCTQTFPTILRLDVLMAQEDAGRLAEAKIDGIVSLDRFGKRNYEISFNPAIIGAREVLSTSNGQLAPPRRDKALAGGQKALFLKLMRFAIATVMTIPVVVLSWGDPPISYNTRSTTALILATGVQLVAVHEFYIPAFKALIFSKSVEMDILVVISITAAYLYSIIAFSLTHAGYTLKEGEFFETSTLLITLVLLSRLVSAYAKLRAVSAVSLRSLQAETAYLQQGDSGPVEIDTRLLEYDDVISIPPHSRVVTDGQVIQGSSTVDESMLTGESTPVPKVEGSAVIAGTINGIGPLRVCVTRLPGQNSISDILNLVSDALCTKPKLQDLADIVAGYFVPVVVGIAMIVLIVWLAVSIKVRHENAGGAVGTAITYSIAVSAISCPCALGLAVPMVLVVAGGVAAKRGVIIKSAEATERSFKVTDVVFDKTGTLTLGDLQVLSEKVKSDHRMRPDVLGLAYSLVRDNEHPVSRALTAHLRGKSVSGVRLDDVESIPGSGIMATWNDHVIKAGNPNWLNVPTHPNVTNLESQGLTTLCLTINDDLIGTFGLQVTTRPEAGPTISKLQARGIRCHIVSGDNTAAVKALARSLHVPEVSVAAQKKPDEKLEYIRSLQASTSTTNRTQVLFVGDGTNDAAAIAQADFGLQIGDTSDISRAVAGVILLGGLDGVVTLLDISRATFQRIIFNFVWSVVYNLFAILLAAGAFVKFRIPPAYAGLGEIVSVLPVIAVGFSITLLNFGKTFQLLES